MLSDDEIRHLWTRHAASKDWSGWLKGYAKWVSELSKLSPQDFLLPANQRRLWDDRYAGTLSWADTARDLAALHQDGALAQLLLDTRETNWADLDDPASALQARFDEVLAIARLVAGGYAFARVSRVFAALTPALTHAGYVHSKLVQISEAVLGDALPSRPHEGRVRSCVRLHELVEPPTTPAEIVLQSTFFWRIYEHVTTPKPAPIGGKASGGTAQPATAGVPATDTPDIESPELDPLNLLPFADLFRGMFPISGLVTTVVEVLDAVHQNGERAVLLAALDGTTAAEGPTSDSWAPFLSRLVGLGLLARDGDVFSIPDSAKPVLSGDLAPIARAMLERTYGLAQLLRIAAGTPAGIPVASAMAALKAGYPAWTSDRVPNALLSWLRALGLVERREGRVRITEHGVLWNGALPKVLPGPVLASAVVLPGPSAPATGPAAPAWAPPTLKALRERFASDPQSKTFVFADGDLAALHHGWHANSAKRFVLLSGLSGTGKTQLLEQYARHYVEGLDAARHIALIPVSPDWRDEGGLLGWHNPLAGGRFVRGAALDLLLAAADDVDGRPYFLLLDEMNLARVERYFAPMLSAMETGRPIRVHNQHDEIDGVPPEISWPANLFVGGTVNVDESTYPFSDKVLDRAFTFEFWDVDLPAFFDRSEHRQADAESLLLSLHAALHPARRHFGYRTAREVVAFTNGAAAEDRTALLDRAVLAKVLPKLRGGEGDGVREALEGVRKVCLDRGLPRSAAKCDAMLHRLAHAGMTGFF